MIEIPAAKILNAVEGQGVEVDRDDGVIVVFLDRVAILKISESPSPEVTISPDHSISILSGDIPVAIVRCQTSD